MAAVLGAGAFLAVPQAQAAEPPAWKLTLTPTANYFLPGPADGVAAYTIEAENVGGETTSGAVKLEDLLPAPLSAEAVQLYATPVGFREGGEAAHHDLAENGLCPSSTECEYPGPLTSAKAPPIAPGQKLVMLVRVGVPATFHGSLTDTAKVRGGGAVKAAAASATNEVDPEPPFAITGFSAPLTDASKSNPYTQAGGHPYQLTTEINLATKTLNQESGGASAGWSVSGITPDRDPRVIAAELPPGLVGNPQGVPHCPLASFFDKECPHSTVIGTVGFRAFGWSQGAFRYFTSLYNLQPSGEYPGELGYNAGFAFVLTAGLRSGSDYGLTIANTGVPEIGLQRVRVTTWGVPADPSHDALRGKTCSLGFENKFQQSYRQAEEECEASHQPGEEGPAEVEETPFLTMPTQCSGSSLSFAARSTAWQLPGVEASATTTDRAVDGCNLLSFEPTIEARPTTNLADAPSGLKFNLKVPQNEAVTGLATSELKEAVVKLPAGLTVNPSSANGLGACTEAEVGLHAEESAHCPDASKLGTVVVHTALLHEALKGSLYLATPHQNPSGSLLGGYLVFEGQGIRVKLPGSFQTDPASGQITAHFPENPQLPFEELELEVFGGARGALRTPAVCGTYESHSTLTPYSAPESGPPAEPTSEFETSAGPTGGACPTSPASEPHSPVLHAGTESPAAGVYSPFSLKLVRQDGEQEIKGIETTLPEGLVGRLAGTSYCPDVALAAAAQKTGVAEQASPSCPAGSEVGTVDVAAGAGPTPLSVAGKAYLAGPYKGAPLSLAIVTPAVAGPFDLGDVVVRTALYVDPLTTEITAKSDPIPTILEGIPLDVRSITLQISRPKFTLNPTSCEPMAITGSALSALGASTALAQRFQVGGCQALSFKPSLKISLKGSTKHAGHPGLKAVLTYPKGGPYANVAKALVNLPHSEFIDQANLNKTCTRPVLLEGACPAKSIYGKAKAWTPLLEKPLEGPVYLVGGFGYKLPALVAELDGQIRVLLVGKVDSGKNKGIRNTFEAVPDAPVEKFVLEMKGGPKYSLLENSENLCSRPQKAIASFTAQSGKVLNLHPTVANDCGKKGKRHHKKHAKHHGPRGKSGSRHARAGSPAGDLAALLSRGW